MVDRVGHAASGEAVYVITSNPRSGPSYQIWQVVAYFGNWVSSRGFRISGGAAGSDNYKAFGKLLGSIRVHETSFDE